MSFMNTYRHTVDKKGRVFIPSKLREELGDNFVVSVPLDGQPCLSVYPAANWDVLQEKIEALSSAQKLRVHRIVNGRACRADCDAQGRVNIPQELRNYAGIVDNVCIIGNGSTIEIWDEDKWNKTYEQLEAEDIAAIMAGIDF